MSRRDRHDSDRRGERRDTQPDEEQQRRLGEVDLQESDSLTALKAILSRVAALLNPLQLTPEESIRLVEQLYGSVLETDVRLAGEADDTRKSSILAYIQNTSITREAGKIVVQYQSNKEEPTGEPAPKEAVAAAVAAAEAEAPPAAAPDRQTDAPEPPPAAAVKARTAATPGKARAGAGTRSATPRASARTTAPAADQAAAEPPAKKPAEAPAAED